MSKKGKVPAGLDLENTGVQTSKYFPKPVPIGVPQEYYGVATEYNPQPLAPPAAMPKKSESKSGTSKGKGNASPFVFGSNAIKSKTPKAPATTKLNPVPTTASYSDKTRSSARAAKTQPSLDPRDFPSPTDHSRPRPKVSKRNAQADEDVIEVDGGESEEEIEEAVEVTAAPPALNARVSMSMNIVGSSNRRIEKTAVIASAQAQMFKEADTKVQAKSRDLGVKGKAKNTLHELGKQRVLFSDVKELHVNENQISEKYARGLLVFPEKSKLRLQPRESDHDKHDLEIPNEASIRYWLAIADQLVHGFMMDGQVTERMRNEWYKAIPGITPQNDPGGRQRFLIYIEFERAIPKDVMRQAFPNNKFETVLPSTLVHAYSQQMSSFLQEKGAAHEALAASDAQSPRPAQRSVANTAQQSSKVSRPLPKRRANPNSLEPLPTRTQPERSARTAAASTQAEQHPNKAEPPAYPDLLLREWPTDGRTEVIITQGDFYRLEEAEYLNDTLIEFGLKHHWFAMPDESNGETRAFTRNDIHIFNSFFYKKLSVRNKPGYKEANPDGPSWPAYETVRKWTNKVDVFKKKMLVIPINENLHWYLAIILNPGEILKKTGAKGSSDSTVHIVDLDSLKSMKEELLAQQLEEEKEREDAVQKQANADEKRKEDEDSQSQDPLDVISSSPKPANTLDDDQTSVEEVEELPNQDSDPEPPQPAGQPRGRNQQPVPIPPPSQPVPLTPPPDFVPQETTKSTRRGPINPPPSKPKTEFAPHEPVIMSFDSLGAPHPTVGKILNKWLVYEAIDKMKARTQLTDIDWDTHFPAAYKYVRVPGQDNFADCGLYVLHYAIQLMKDAGELRDHIFEQGPVKGTAEEKNQEKERNKDMWDAHGMLNKRGEWKKMIIDLPKGKSDVKNDEAKQGGAVSVDQQTGPLVEEPGAKRRDGENSAPSTDALGEANPVTIEVRQAQTPTTNPPAMSTDGSLQPPISTPRASPSKRAISISPIASQDAPVNKRRKIISADERASASDVVDDSEPEESSVRREAASEHDMQVDDPLELTSSRLRSPSPAPQGRILVMASPEMTKDLPLGPPTVSALADGLREVKVTMEHSVSQVQCSSGRPSMESPTTTRNVALGRNSGLTDISNGIVTARSSNKETPRDRLRKDDNAEPMRVSAYQASPAAGQRPSKKSGQSMGIGPKLTVEEVQREVASEFGFQDSFATLGKYPLTQFRDNMLQPFRIAHEADDTRMLENLKRHIDRHSREEGNGTDVVNDGHVAFAANAIQVDSDGDDTE